MTPANFRFPFQPRDSVKLLVPAVIAAVILGFFLVLVATSHRPWSGSWIAPALLACAAALAIIATIRSAGIAITKVFPSLRTTVLGGLAIAILLTLGGLLASPLGRYESGRETGLSVGSIVLAPARMTSEGMPGRAILWQAERIDAVVQIWARNERKETSYWLGRFYRTLPYVAESRARDRQNFHHLAQGRLKLLAPGTEAWKATEGLCREFRVLFPEGNHYWPDFNRQYEEIASSYSYLLSRNVSKQELMPLVPGGKCD